MITRILIVVLSLALLALLLGTYLLSRPGFDEAQGPNLYSSVKIAPGDQALTLARTLEGRPLLAEAPQILGGEGVSD